MGLVLVACTTSAPPSLVPLAGPAVVGRATSVAVRIDTNGRVLSVVSSATDTTERVSVLEESGDGLHARAWPGDLDVVVDMPSVAIGPEGVAAIALRVGPNGSGGDVVLARRSADGSWSEPTRDDIVSAPPRAYEPRAVFEPSGALVLAMNQGAAARDGYGVAIASATGIDAPIARPAGADDVVSSPVFFSNSPRPVVDAHGGAMVTWYQSLGGVLLVFYAERRAGESRFVLGDSLSVDATAVDSAGPPDPAMSADGTFAVAWGQDDGRGGVSVFLAMRRPGESFDRPRSLDDRLSIGDGVARGIVTSVASEGTIRVAWSERIAARERVFLATLAPGAARSEALVEELSAADADADSPALALSGSNLAIVFVEHASTDRVVLRRGDVRETIAEGSELAAPSIAYENERLAMAWIAGRQPVFAATPR